MDSSYQLPIGETDHTKSRDQVSPGLRWSRLALRILSSICGCANIGFSAFYYSKWTVGALLMMGPHAIASVIWSLGDIIFISVRRGVHPSVCITLDILLTVALAAISGVLIFTIAKLSDPGWYFALFRNEEGVEYLGIVAGFGILGVLSHLISLILAIYELTTRRRASIPHNYMAGTQQQNNVGEAPPAYSGPLPSMQQNPEYNMTRPPQWCETPTKQAHSWEGYETPRLELPISGSQ